MVDLGEDPISARHEDHHIVSVAIIVAVGGNTDGRREVLGMTIGHSEAEPFWVEFLRNLARHGLRGVKLVVSDAHEGLKAAITKVLSDMATVSRVFHAQRRGGNPTTPTTLHRSVHALANPHGNGRVRAYSGV